MGVSDSKEVSVSFEQLDVGIKPDIEVITPKIKLESYFPPKSKTVLNMMERFDIIDKITTQPEVLKNEDFYKYSLYLAFIYGLITGDPYKAVDNSLNVIKFFNILSECNTDMIIEKEP
jgi:hypothetical protein